METTNFKYRVAQVMSGEYPPREKVRVCDTPPLYKDIGMQGDQIVIEQNKLRACLASADSSAYEHAHDLPIDFVDGLSDRLKSPAMVLASQTQPNSIVIVSDRIDKCGDPIIVALSDGGRLGNIDGEVVKYTKLASMYGKQNFTEFLRRSLENNGLLYLDIKKSRDLAVSAGLQLPGVLANLDSMTIIRRYNENVNTFKQKILRNPKNFAPENYGQTLYRHDGLPFAYVDPDGRQRLTEYGTKEDGTAYVVKTTVTLSDGRTEKTEYDRSGKVTALERSTADGCETYSYSSGYTWSHETSVVHGGENKYFQSKSVHEKRREKKEERGWDHDSTKESWQEQDGRGNVILSKHNVYGDNDRLQSSSDVRYEYDRYGNRISAIYDDGSVYKTEYYPPSMVRDHFGFEVDDYDAGAVDHDRIKTETARYADGSIRIKQYTLEGEYTESEYSPDGKLTEFTNADGKTFQGKAAELELLKSQGQAPTKADVKAKAERSSTAKPAAKSDAKTKAATTSKTGKTKKPMTFCKGCNAAKGGRDGGAGR